MKILFIWPGVRLPGFGCFRAGTTSSDAVYMNHGLSMISAMLKRQGHECFLIDLRKLQNWEEFEQKIKTLDFDVTLTGFHSVDRDFAIQACQTIKKYYPNKPIIAGGPHLTIAQEKELPGVDCIVWGEGDLAIVDLINDLKHLPKLITGKIVEKVDELPFVDRELFDCSLEKNAPLLPLLPLPFYTVNIGRGCPSACRFCHQSGNNPIFTKKWRLRSVDNFLDEIGTIISNTGQEIGSLMIHDDVFPHRKWCDEFIEKMNWRIPFWCQMRADFICNNEDLIPGLTEKGLTWVSLGIESGSQRMLDFLNKRTTVEQNKRAIDILHRNNINIFANFFFGGPTETKEDIDLSGELIKQSKLSWHSFSTYTCYPGSDLYKYCVDNDLFLNEHYRMERYPYERKIKGVDYDYLFKKIAEFSQYKGDLRQYVPSHSAILKNKIRRFSLDLSPQKDITVSVIMTSHNRPELLSEAIESIFKQSMKNWELIIIDDFSTDPKVLDVLNQAKRDSRVRAFRTNYDVDNIAVSWNLELDLSRGEYICFLDDDNLKEERFLEELSSFLEKNADFYAVCCFNKYMQGDKLNGGIFDSPRYANKENILEINQIDSGCIMFRKSLVKKIGYFDERFRTAEDWDYIIRIMLQAGGFGLIEKALAVYRIHEGRRMERSEILGYNIHKHFITKVKNYSSKLKLLFFHQDEHKITLSQNNVLKGVRDALKNIEWIELECVPVSKFKTIKSKYDIVFCFAPFVIEMEYIKELKNLGNEIINFHIEDPQALMTNIERAKYATYVFTNDISVQGEYEKIVGKGNVGYCCSISLNDVSVRLREKSAKKYDVAFVGYPYDSRLEFIKEMASKINKSYNCILVGGDWSKRSTGLTCIDELPEQPLMEIMEESKLIVLYNRRNTDLGTDIKLPKPMSMVRGYFESGSGSLILIDEERRHHSFNGEVIFYKNVDDLIEKVDYYMAHDAERLRIGEMAKKKALSDFTYSSRITKLLNSVRSRRYYIEIE